jgi:hypothetical protein
MSSPDGFQDGFVLADNETSTQGIVGYNDPGGRDMSSVYVVGLSSDTVNVEYRPNENRPWANIVELKSDSPEFQTLHNMPEGEYRLNRNGNNSDTITVALI